MKSANKKKPAYIANGRRWRRIAKATAWMPTEPGTEIIGRYGGLQTRNGKHGEYRVLVLSHGNEMYTISGSEIISLIEAAGAITPEHHLRVVYTGMTDFPNGYRRKNFELYVSV